MIKKTTGIIIAGFVFVMMSFALGCSAGGLTPFVSDISGPDKINEGSFKFYEVQVSGTNIQCTWSCEPQWAGTLESFSEWFASNSFSGGGFSSAGGFPSGESIDTDPCWRSFSAHEVTEDTGVIITAIVTSDEFEPVVVKKKITILDVPVP